MLRKILGNFRQDEIGAVTVDWVVITGLIILITLVVTPGFVSELEAAGLTIGNKISDASTALP